MESDAFSIEHDTVMKRGRLETLSNMNSFQEIHHVDTNTHELVFKQKRAVQKLIGAV